MQKLTIDVRSDEIDRSGRQLGFLLKKHLGGGGNNFLAVVGATEDIKRV